MLLFRKLTSMGRYKTWQVTKEDVLLFVTIRCLNLIGLEGILDLIFFGQKLYTNGHCDIAHRGKEKNFCAEIWVKMHRPSSNANAPKCEKIYEKACIFSCPFIFTRCHRNEATVEKYDIFLYKGCHFATKNSCCPVCQIWRPIHFHFANFLYKWFCPLLFHYQEIVKKNSHKD